MINILSKKRYDCIIIWGHGLVYLNEIINEIENNSWLSIKMIQKYRPKNIKKFVKDVYSYDYAPFWHLKNKTRYLYKYQKEVCFIFFENLIPNEDYIDIGQFRHKESMTLKKFKRVLRQRFNPYKDGKITEYHVIHATDSQDQTDYLLKYLGYKEGIELFTKINSKVPYHIKYKDCIIKKTNVSDLWCNIAIGENWDDFSIQTVKINESPQYLGLSQNINIYQSYLDKFLGGPLKDYYSPEKFIVFAKNFNYLSSPFETSYIVTKKINDKHVVFDGLHRASICSQQKRKEIIICQII